MKQLTIVIFLFVSTTLFAQYRFSGEVDTSRWQSDVYLSLIEDYRQLNGIFSEQIIARTSVDTTGRFEFTGNQLETDHRLYRLHVDNCHEERQDANHFSGSCPDSQSIIFIAKNTDSIEFPFTFENEMFCDLKSSNNKAIALMQIDSLKEEMRYAFSEIRSEASKKLNTKKWFATLQEFGASLDEPLAELYVYSYVSDRGSEFYDYYKNDLRTNNYYTELQQHLESNYPESSYTKQYITELEADQFSVSKNQESTNWHYLIYVALAISLLLNFVFIYNNKRAKKNHATDLKEKLTQQEKKILELLLTDATNKDIAEQLFVSLSTIKTHVNNIYKKYNVQSRNALKNLFAK